MIWKTLTIFLLGIVAGYFIFPKEEINNIQGDLIEEQKVKNNSKHKDNRKRKGLLGWLKRDPKKKEERLARKELRKQNKK